MTLTNDSRAMRILSVLYTTEGPKVDVLDRLMPFFGAVLSESYDEIYSPTKLAAGLKLAYGWSITPEIAEEMGPRFAANGWLTSLAPENRDNIGYQVKLEPQETLESDEGRSIEEIIDTIGSSFLAFAKNISALLMADTSQNEALEWLVEWLVSLDVYTADSLAAEARSYKDPVTNQLKVIETKLNPTDGLNPEQRYLCARFLRHLEQEQPDLLADVARIAEVGYLSDLVEDFRAPSAGVTRSDLTVYLDSSIALALLNVSGESAHKNAESIVSALKSVGCLIRVFNITTKEMAIVLSSVIGTDRPKRDGPTHEAIIKREVDENFVTAVSKNPTAFLEKIGVGIDPTTLETAPNSHNHFPKDLFDTLFGRINWNFAKPRQKEHDATIATLVMRKRAERKDTDIFGAKFLVVTTNPKFAALAKRFCVHEGLLSENDIPPVITHRQLAVRTWLRTGLDATQSLPLNQVLAACERVLTVRKDLVSKAINRTKDMSETQREQFLTLVEHEHSRQVLMDRTLNSHAICDQTDIPNLLDEMKASLISDHEKLSQAETDRLVEEHRAEKRVASKGHRATKRRLADAEATLKEVAQIQRRAIEQNLEKITPLIACIRPTFIVVAILFSSALWYITYTFAYPISLIEKIGFYTAILLSVCISGGSLIGMTFKLQKLRKVTGLFIARKYLEFRGADVSQLPILWSNDKIRLESAEPSQENGTDLLGPFDS